MAAEIGAQLRRGVAEYCVLGLLSREPMYGWRLAEELGAAGLIASIGTLYPLLGRLGDNGWVTSFHAPSESGPARKYYELTDDGRRQLSEFRSQWMPFAHSVADLLGEETHR